MEMPLQLSVEGGGVFKCKLVGMEYGRYLLVKMPHMPDIAMKLYEKNHIIVRYIHAGNVYGFRSTMTGILKEPLRLFVLSYPEAIEIHSARKNDRFDCMIPASLRDAQDPGGEAWKGIINDISLGGCRFRVKLTDQIDLTKRVVGSTLTISFGFLNEETWQVLETELRSMTMDKDQVILGLLFKTDVDTKAQQTAMEFIRGMITTLLD